ncbi:MAG: efflux RND transporter periplasmic adaptor subunit [Neisseria sp.]|nr:efflux RND transporter periplasmic adaptor subunit [Neisseria sp.]
MTNFQGHLKPVRAAVLAVALAFGVAACSGGDKAAGQAQSEEAPAPVVGVVTVEPTTVTLSTELPARLEAFRSADVRAQVGGVIQKRLFQEGSFVKAGQPLFQVDSSAYEANLHSARASLLSAEASLAKADADLARYKPLVEADAISKQEYDAAIAARRAAIASVESSKAAIHSAQISLNRSRITAPISGVIGAAKVSEGTLVSAGDATVLATIKQTNPLYVNITQSATEVMKLRQQYADGKVQAVGNGGAEADILLEDGSTYPLKARLVFADMTVDEATGQVRIRAEVPNPQNVLFPNLYVRVRLPQADVANAFLVPQQSVTRGDNDTVMIVNAQGGMEPRTVKVAGAQNGNWIITEGLQAGDKVIVDGTMIAGMTGAKKVQPKEWTPPSDASNAAPNAAASQAASEAQTASAAK